MGKLKTHKGIAKRFKKTKNGKLMHKKSGYVHKLTKKKTKNKRDTRKMKRVKGKIEKNLKKMIRS